MSAPAWLTARPIAHRGLHDRGQGCFENTLSAAAAAVGNGFAIECDVQLSADGEAMVFHDFTLDRLTTESGAVGDRTARELATIGVGGSDDRIPRLTELLDHIGARVPLICEIKSRFSGDRRLADRALEIIGAASGPVAIKSFDPGIVAHLRAKAGSAVPLGIVAEASYEHSEWDEFLAPEAKRRLAALSDFDRMQPDFLSYAVDDLPHAAATLMRAGLRRPVMTWTVRTALQRERATQWADQMVFEGFLPEGPPRA